MPTQKIDAADKLRQLLKESGAMTPQISSLISKLKMDRDHAQLVCAEAYCVMGDLAHTLRLWNGSKMEKIMDNLAAHRLVHKDVLPFTTREVYKFETGVIKTAEKLYKAAASGDAPTANELRDWAEALEGSNTHLLEDIYSHCCGHIDPLVKLGLLPASVGEAITDLVETFREHHGLPTDINPEGSGNGKDAPDEDEEAA